MVELQTMPVNGAGMPQPRKCANSLLMNRLQQLPAVVAKVLPHTIRPHKCNAVLDNTSRHIVWHTSMCWPAGQQPEPQLLAATASPDTLVPTPVSRRPLLHCSTPVFGSVTGYSLPPPSPPSPCCPPLSLFTLPMSGTYSSPLSHT